ncbi:Cysteine protease atg4 [Rhizophlyctis rosea]|uniref:Cysteine protease n=1 Tax=Rhizophlyctis rosea TaxID=64517 RepID=A0AAD5S6W7_9FUNG|nr:Cysteine protease atg4 [Rhizophlyctis rosea]
MSSPRPSNDSSSFTNPSAQPPQPSHPTDPSLWDKVSESFSNLVTAATDRFRTSTDRTASPNPSDDSLLNRLSARTGVGPINAGDARYKPSGTVTFLATTYPNLADDAFYEDFKSRPWMTYRHSYPCIKPSQFTSDVGWGCMLRSGQMMLANAFLFHELGRDWRLSRNSDRDSWITYVKIMSWFLDSNTSPYSIHRIALLGKQYEKEIGEWFGPSTISQVLCALLQSHKDSTMSLHIASDGVIYKDEVKKVFAASSPDDGAVKGKNKAVLILMPLRLGLENLNPVYYPGLKECFTIPQCVGIAGGRPNSSLFFLGTEGDNLIYLDPHYLRPTADVKDITSYTQEDLSSFHCETIRVTSIGTVDPSLVIGFYCRDESDFEDLCARSKTISEGKTPLFTIEDTAPDYNDKDADILSDTDEF